MAFDLPIDDVTSYVEELLVQIGKVCTIDGVATKIMISDLQRAFSNIDENSKQAVVSKKIAVDKGSIINFADGTVGLAYTIPNDDIVSLSMKILMCNANVEILRYEEVFDEDPASSTFGDILNEGEISKGFVNGFIERLTAREKQYDVGLLHESVLRFISDISANIQMDDIVVFKKKKYRVIDIDEITEGLCVIQLASVRS
ncbi:hypothetical protein [Paenibacillus chitinolyticus]|uniref:hypothetical protein n=1 Tax=Paenibacillus chitinolyticus TaxID=79263 RepID=UPI003CFFB341